MARLRFLAVALLALVFVGNPTQTGRSAGQNKDSVSASSWASPATPAVDGGSCTIYALADMGYDSNLGQWIAQTIPDMIEPSSWQGAGGTGTLRYYPPKNILIIKHSAAIHAKVDSFLKDLKKSLPDASERKSATSKNYTRHSIVPVSHQVPVPLQASGPLPEASGYPVPAPVKPPKHLFHFLIRYEGEGIIDDNVVKYFKATSQAEKPETSEKVVGERSNRPAYAGGRSESLSTPPPPVYLKENDPKVKEDKKDNEKETSDKVR